MPGLRYLGPTLTSTHGNQHLFQQHFPTQCNRSSSDTEDLAAMVHDFIESGSSEFFDGSDSDGGPPGIAKLCETLQVLTSYGGIEGELLHVVRSVVLELNVDVDLLCSTGGNLCKGECTKNLLVNHLRATGYDAAVCKSKWESSSRLLGGGIHAEEYEYIDVETRNQGHVERYIIDVNFQDQFVLARATPHYLMAMKLLPTVFVGTTKRLEQILEIMSEAAKVSLEQNCMPLPPWRTLAFMSCKWLSPRVRTAGRHGLLSNSLEDPCSQSRNKEHQTHLKLGSVVYNLNRRMSHSSKW